MQDRYRTIIESEEFGLDKEHLSSDPILLDEALFGVTTVLARRPDLGHRTPAEGVWLIYTRPLRGQPIYAIYYEFDDDSVTLRGMKEAS